MDLSQEPLEAEIANGWFPTERHKKKRKLRAFQWTGRQLRASGEPAGQAGGTAMGCACPKRTSKPAANHICAD
jgi:hypothetical protein